MEKILEFNLGNAEKAHDAWGRTVGRRTRHSIYGLRRIRDGSGIALLPGKLSALWAFDIDPYKWRR
jgi:hypothetical protein